MRKLKKNIKVDTFTKGLDLISELDRQFVSLQELSLDKILKQCASTGKTLLGSKICSLKLASGDYEVSVCDIGFKTGDILKEGKPWREISRRAVKSKRPVLVRNLELDKGLDRSSTQSGKTNSAICVPIILKNRVLGTLVMADSDTRSFTKEDCRLLLGFANHTAILIDNVYAHREVFSSYINSIKSLVSAIEAKDAYTYGHSEKVTKFALDIASAMGLPEEDKVLLDYCGRLHDIGKIGIRDAILNKQGALTAQERQQIQLHPLKAVEILSSLKFLGKGIPAIKHHHERYDGGGYPSGLKGDEIPLLARILACADSFDAMTSDRAYRPKMKIKEALEEIKTNKGSQFDPQISDIFIDVIKRSKK